VQSETKLLAGVMVSAAFATSALIVLPYLQLRPVKPAAGLKPDTSAELRGREEYIKQGCLYCHSQQPRDRSQAPDGERGWGRPSVAADYYYDRPHLLGTARTGPDLLNIAVRQPSKDWHLGHLYQPRAYAAGSIMPPYPYLFEVKDKPEPGEQVVQVPPEFAPETGVIVAKPQALDLVAYLLSLNRTYPIVEKASP
jgi:cytochrome c oxidase cbb3-type subunit II